MSRATAALAGAILVLATLTVGPGALAAEGLDVPAPEAITTVSTVPAESVQAPTEAAPVAAQAEEESSHAAASSSGSVVNLDVMGEEGVTLSESTSNAGQASSGGSSSGSSSSHATLLSVLGTELWGADANSKEGANEREGLLLEVTDQICSGSSGQLCVSLLYEERNSSKKDGNSEEKSVASVCAGGEQTQAGHDCNGPISLTVGYAGASAHEDGDGTESSSDTALVDACVGSAEHSASDTCDGPVGARVAESHSDSSSETDSPDDGDTSAESGAENSGAEVCAGGEDAESGTCGGVGAVILHSETFSSANTQGASQSEGLAHTFAIEAQGEEQFSMSEEADISVPPDCPDQSVLCLFLNGVESNAEAGKAGASATAIAAEVGKGILGEEAILDGTVDDSSSTVDLGEDDKVKGKHIVKDERKPDAPGATAPFIAAAPAPEAAVMPFTGDRFAALIFLALSLIVIGATMTRGSKASV